MPVKQGELNYQQSPLFDTYELGNGVAAPVKIVFFETPSGAAKGLNLTNLKRPFQLMAGENFTVYAMRLLPVAMDEADLLGFQQNYAATLIVSGKVLLQAPVEYWTGGAGAVIQKEGGSLGTAEYANNGCADAGAVALLDKEPILIDSGESFRVELDGPTFTATCDVFLRCYLEGVYGRLVG